MWQVEGVTVFTAFTVVTVYNTAASTSRLTTIYNEFPENFTLPEVNSLTGPVSRRSHTPGSARQPLPSCE